MVEVNDPDSNNETINCCGMKATLRMGPKYAAGQRKANDSDMRHVIVPNYLRWRCGPQMRRSRISFSFFFFRFSSSRRASSLNATSSSFLAMRALTTNHVNITVAELRRKKKKRETNLRNSSLLNASASTSMSSPPRRCTRQLSCTCSCPSRTSARSAS